jgi:hypothetical protein
MKKPIKKTTQKNTTVKKTVSSAFSNNPFLTKLIPFNFSGEYEATIGAKKVRLKIYRVERHGDYSYAFIQYDGESWKRFPYVVTAATLKNLASGKTVKLYNDKPGNPKQGTSIGSIIKIKSI